MATIGDRYVLGGKRDHDRLRMISEIHDGRLGYVTRWAATQGVDTIGIDVNPEQVAAAQALAVEAGLDRAECRTGSVYEPGLEPESINISYSRWLMVHLQRPVDAMRAGPFRTHG